MAWSLRAAALVALVGYSLAAGRDLTSSAAAPEQSYDNSTLRLGPAFLQGPAPSFAPIPLAFAPDASVQATDTPLGLQSALSANSSRVATQAANIINYTQCNSSCGTGCSDFTENNAAALNYLNYLQYPATTGSCSDCGGFFQAAADLVGVSTCTQYSCCVQVCSVDTDCPADYYCQSGYPIGAACKKCDACDVTTNSKCQTDQSCTYTYDCCLDSVTEFCYVPWNVGAPTQLDLNSGEYCCPSSPSSYNSFENGVCSCGSQQSCGYPPPPPPNSPPPPSAPPPPPRAPLLPVSSVTSSAATVPVVAALQTLSGFTVTTFDATAQSQFIATLTTNIGQLSGPVNVTIIPGSIRSGSVVVGTQVAFLNGDTDSASNYVSAIKSDNSVVFGTYDATVDTSTITQSSTDNPNAQTASSSPSSSSTSGCALPHTTFALVSGMVLVSGWLFLW